MMLRRLKEDVEKSLAPKEETIVEVSQSFGPSLMSSLSVPTSHLYMYYPNLLCCTVCILNEALCVGLGSLLCT